MCKQILPWCAKVMYLFKQLCVHVQQPPISSQSFNTVPLTSEESRLQSGGHWTVCGVRARVVARLCHQLRGSLHHILVGSESTSSRDVPRLALSPGGRSMNCKRALRHMLQEA